MKGNSEKAQCSEEERQTRKWPKGLKAKKILSLFTQLDVCKGDQNT